MVPSAADRNPCLAISSSTRGRASSTTGTPRAERAERPSCMRRMSPAARLRTKRRATTRGSLVTVSKPRRVHDTSDSPSALSTAGSHGFCMPAGARKNRGRAAPAAAKAACPRCTSARRAADRPSANPEWWLNVWFSMPWPRARMSAIRSGCCCARRPMQKNVATAPACSSSASTRGVTSGSGPSSKVSASTPGGGPGSLVMLGPSSRLRGAMLAAAMTA